MNVHFAHSIGGRGNFETRRSPADHPCDTAGSLMNLELRMSSSKSQGRARRHLGNLASEPLEEIFTPLPYPSGYLHCLTAEQEDQLFQLWLMLFNFFKIPFHHPKDMRDGFAEELFDQIRNDISREELADLGEEGLDKMESNPLLDELLCQSAFEDPDRIILRFLRARRWDAVAAFNQIVNTLHWRYSHNVREIMRQGEYDPMVAKEMETGKVFLWKQDMEGRQVNYMIQKKYQKEDVSPEFLEKLAIYNIETAKLIPIKAEQLACTVWDLKGASWSNMLDIAAARIMVNACQDYYPEMMGNCVIKDSPYIFQGLWRLVRTWLDPIVASKINFVNGDELFNYCDAECVPQSLGGKDPFEFIYSPPDGEGPVELTEEEQAEFREHGPIGRQFVLSTLEYINTLFNLALNEKLEEFHEKRKGIKQNLTNAHRKFADRTYARNIYHHWKVI